MSKCGVADQPGGPVLFSVVKGWVVHRVYAVFSARVIDPELYLHLFTLLGVTLIDRLIGCFLARLLLQDGAGSITAVQQPKPSTGIRPPFALEPTTIHSTSIVSYRIVSYRTSPAQARFSSRSIQHATRATISPFLHSILPRRHGSRQQRHSVGRKRIDRQTDRPTEKEAEKKSGEETKEERRKKRTYEDPSR